MNQTETIGTPAATSPTDAAVAMLEKQLAEVEGKQAAIGTRMEKTEADLFDALDKQAKELDTQHAALADIERRRASAESRIKAATAQAAEQTAADVLAGKKPAIKLKRTPELAADADEVDFLNKVVPIAAEKYRDGVRAFSENVVSAAHETSDMFDRALSRNIHHRAQIAAQALVALSDLIGGSEVVSSITPAGAAMTLVLAAFRAQDGAHNQSRAPGATYLSKSAEALLSESDHVHKMDNAKGVLNLARATYQQAAAICESRKQDK